LHTEMVAEGTALQKPFKNTYFIREFTRMD